jgi:hypothetical protein
VETEGDGIERKKQQEVQYAFSSGSSVSNHCIYRMDRRNNVGRMRRLRSRKTRKTPHENRLKGDEVHASLVKEKPTEDAKRCFYRKPYGIKGSVHDGK